MGRLADTGDTMNRTKIQLLIALCLATAIAQSQDLGGLLGGLAKPQDGVSRRATSTFRAGPDGKYDPKAHPTGDLKEHSNYDNFQVAPGATHVLMDEKGPGVITHIWMTFLGPEPQDWAKEGSANHRDMLLRIYYDGSDRPGVEAPVGDFFANCFGKRSEVISLPVVVEDGDSYNCFWQMPFRKACRVEIVNQSTKPISLLYYNIDWIQRTSLPKDTPYFYAQYRQEYPAVSGRDYTVLETTGKGHFVGTVLSVRTRSPMWFGEGDEKIYIDGEDRPSIWGTGTEDYFLSAWGLKTTKTPYTGVPYFDQWGIVGGHTSAYRWHLADPIVFQKGIKVTLEHYGWISPDENAEGKTNSWNEREDDYASVAFWYQTGTPTFSARAPSGAERQLPNIDRVIAFAKDGYKTGTGNASLQQLEFYDNPQVFFKIPAMQELTEPGLTNVWLSIPFTVAKTEPLRLLLNATTSYDYGRYQVYLDGVPLWDPLDFYSAKTDSREFHLLDFYPTPGKHELQLRCMGRNPASQGFFCGIESVRLRERRPRVSQFGRDKDNDWKTKPLLYN